MIITDKGTIKMKGPIYEIKADLCVVIKAFRENVLQEECGCGREEAEAIISKLIEDSRKSKAELEEEGW